MLKESIGVMIINLTSRMLGFVRGAIIAYYFGASAVTDAFFSAFKISNFFRQLLGEGALGNAFIPLYNERVQVEGDKNSKEFMFSILNLLFIFSSIITILMFIFSTQIIDAIVNGFPEETKLMASKLLKIMSFYFIFISISGMICAILNNFKQFLWAASTSIFFNLAIIFAAIFSAKYYGIKALAYGVVIGGIFQVLVVLPSFFKIVKTYSFKINFRDPYLKKLFILIAPMLIGIVARQVNTIVDQMFASYLEAGGVTALENATRLYQMPVGVFGVSLSTVIFPGLALAIAKNQFEKVGKDLVKGMNILLFLVIPSLFALTFFSKDIVKLTLAYGKFGEDAVLVTSDALFYYSLGLYFYVGIYLLSKAFYGMKDSINPVKFSIVSIIINILLNYLLIGPLKYKGLALSSSIAAAFNFFALLIVFRYKYIKFPLNKFYIFLTKTIIASSIAILLSYYINNSFIKLLLFSIIYLVFWSYSFYKERMKMF